jgi:hypothetical protein
VSRATIPGRIQENKLFMKQNANMQSTVRLVKGTADEGTTATTQKQTLQRTTALERSTQSGQALFADLHGEAFEAPCLTDQVIRRMSEAFARNGVVTDKQFVEFLDDAAQMQRHSRSPRRLQMLRGYRLQQLLGGPAAV